MYDEEVEKDEREGEAEREATMQRREACKGEGRGWRGIPRGSLHSKDSTSSLVSYNELIILNTTMINLQFRSF